MLCFTKDALLFPVTTWIADILHCPPKVPSHLTFYSTDFTYFNKRLNHTA